MYLFSTVVALQADLSQIKAEAALAREELKEEIRDEVKANTMKIAVLEEQVKQLQEKESND